MLQAHSACPFFLGIGCSLIAPTNLAQQSPLKSHAAGLQIGINSQTPTRYKRADELVGGELEETASSPPRSTHGTSIKMHPPTGASRVC